MPAPKLELRSLLTKNTLPGNGNPLERGQGTPFTFYWCRDTREMFFTDVAGNFVNFGSLLAAVLDGSTPLAFPATGCAGADGATGAVGSRGPAGPAGRDGNHGKDSITPGPAGRDGASIVGPQGPAGPAGRDGAVGAVGPQGPAGPQGPKGEKGDYSIPTDTEIGAALVALRSKHAKIQAALLYEISRLKSLHPNQRIHVKNVLDRISKEIV